MGWVRLSRPVRRRASRSRLPQFVPLSVEADGRSATVRAPGPATAITSIGTGTAGIALI
jgi:hypothetical protein